MDAAHQAAFELEYDEIGWRGERDFALVDQHRSATIDRAGGERPLLACGFICPVILPNLAFAAFLERRGDEVEFHVVGEHCAHCVEIADLEPKNRSSPC